jgi:hypothetical protein
MYMYMNLNSSYNVLVENIWIFYPKILKKNG